MLAAVALHTINARCRHIASEWSGIALFDSDCSVYRLPSILVSVQAGVRSDAIIINSSIFFKLQTPDHKSCPAADYEADEKADEMMTTGLYFPRDLFLLRLVISCSVADVECFRSIDWF